MRKSKQRLRDRITRKSKQRLGLGSIVYEREYTKARRQFIMRKSKQRL